MTLHVLFCLADDGSATANRTSVAGDYEFPPLVGRNFILCHGYIARITTPVTHVETLPDGVTEFETESGSIYHLVPLDYLQVVYNGSVNEAD